MYFGGLYLGLPNYIHPHVRGFLIVRLYVYDWWLIGAWYYRVLAVMRSQLYLGTYLR